MYYFEPGSKTPPRRSSEPNSRRARFINETIVRPVNYDVNLPGIDQQLTNTLPELSKQIFANFNCQDLRNARANKTFSNLMTKEVVDQARNKGFPRRDGRYRQFEFDDANETIGFDKSHRTGEEVDLIFEDYFSTFNDRDIVRGDIVRFRYTSGFSFYRWYIFDGCLFHQLRDSDDLPKQFTILENNVPKDYWYNKKVNLNLIPIKDQINKYILTNAGKFRDKVIIPFTINRQKYYLELQKSDLAKLKNDTIKVKPETSVIKVL